MSIPRARMRATSAVESVFRVRRFPLILLGLCLAIGCSDSPIQGTYAVSLLIDQASAPIDATLIIWSTYLEGRSHFANPGAARDEAVGDPNSCLIIPSNDLRDDTPRSVTYFQSRIRSGELVVPMTIFETSEQRIEITKVKFFANAVGGDIAFHSDSDSGSGSGNTERVGRIVGDRQGGPDATRCNQALAKFNSAMEELLRAARDDPER